MRIVAGIAKGRRLVAPTGRDVRPTADRVREAVFSSLGARVLGARVLDLFAGSGALGLEALSRGAAEAVFVERSRAVIDVLARNIELVGAGDRSRIVRGEFATALATLASEGACFDLVFLDPPYDAGLVTPALRGLWERRLLGPGARIVVEQRRKDAPELTGNLRICASKSYGDTAITMIDAPGAAEQPDNIKEEL